MRKERTTVQQASAGNERIQSPGGMAVKSRAQRWGLTIPHRYGGEGAGLRSTLEVIRALSRESLTTPAILSSHLRAVTYLLKAGTDLQRQRYLPLLARGELVAAHALSEKADGTGSRLHTAVTQHRNGYRLSGTKHWVTNARDSSLLVVLCRQPFGNGLSGVLIPRDRYGELSFLPLERAGMLGVSLCEVTFSNYPLDPERDLIGGLRTDLAPCVAAAKLEKYLNFAARAVGLAESIGEEAKRILGEPQRDPHPVALNRLGEIQGYIFAAQAAFERAVDLSEAGSPRPAAAMAARLACTRALMHAIEHSTNALGGSGYAAPYNRLAQMIQDASSLVVAGTPLDRLASELGRGILGGESE